MLETVYRRETPWVLQDPQGSFRLDAPLPRVLFPGSFNPLHLGHTTLAERAGERLGAPVAFELSIANVEKPDLPPHEVLRRLDQFRARAPVYVSRAPTFREKALLFPGSVFIVGADTAVRIVDPRFYGNDPAAMVRALDTIRAAGCRFLVGGRVNAAGQFVGADAIAVPASYRDMFTGLSEGEFRVDISSSELRV